ncbi:MAG: hypothetical protein PHE43_01850 [Candidatus Nanoarchaeia archaeon]|nr:hypothetical protein [Candidatus Nanoarchaeia archaeon]
MEEAQRRNKIILRWSILTAGLIALFWAIWYLITGNVPIVNKIEMTGHWNLALSFGISRWWDILIGPIWSTILIIILTNKRIKNQKNFKENLFVFGLNSGIVLILALSGIMSNFNFHVLSLGVAGLFFGIAEGWSKHNFEFGLGLVLGSFLILTLVSGIAVTLLLCLISLTLILFFKTFVRLWRWLSAEDYGDI